MSAPSLETQVIDIIADSCGISEPIGIDDRLEVFGLDDLDVIELMCRLEDEFDIEISDEAAEGLLTVQDIVSFVEKHAEAKA